jgi:signal peptidase I
MRLARKLRPARATVYMRPLCRLCRSLWRREACRFLVATSFAALVGVAAGRAVVGTVIGSVAIVDGHSMEPTFEPGSRVYSTPISSPLNRGDIVLLDDGKGEQALKRVVGLPGETVQIWRGHVFIDSKLLREPYLPKYTYTFPSPRSNTCTFHITQDQFLVLGDNRVCSEDSRYYGPVARAQIKSRVNLIESNLHPYFDPRGHLPPAEKSTPAP